MTSLSLADTRQLNSFLGIPVEEKGWFQETYVYDLLMIKFNSSCCNISYNSCVTSVLKTDWMSILGFGIKRACQYK